MAGKKNKDSDLSTGIDIDPEEFAREALNLGDPDSDDDVELDLDDDVEEEEEVDEEEAEGNPEAPDPESEEDRDNQESGSETSDDGDAAASEGEGEDDDESDPILARARELGLGDNFKSAEEVLDAFKAMKTRFSQRDDDAAFGRFVRERGVTPDKLEALGKQGQGTDGDKKPEKSPKGWNPPFAYDPDWERSIKPRYDDDGEVVGYDGPPDMVSKFQEYSAYERNFWGKVMRDPTRLGDVLAPIIESRVQDLDKARREEARKERSALEAKSFMEKHGDFIDAHEQEFFGLVEEGMNPNRAVEYLQLKHKKPEGPSKGEEAKKKDLDNARARRRTRRAGSKVSPIRKPKPASAKSEDEILEGAFDGLSEEDRAGLGL